MTSAIVLGSDRHHSLPSLFSRTNNVPHISVCASHLSGRLKCSFILQQHQIKNENRLVAHTVSRSIRLSAVSSFIKSADATGVGQCRSESRPRQRAGTVLEGSKTSSLTNVISIQNTKSICDLS